jgi:hypothetical protein
LLFFSIIFADAALVSAFGASETAGGVLQVRQDEPEARIGAGLHRTPMRGQKTGLAAFGAEHPMPASVARAQDLPLS